MIKLGGLVNLKPITEADVFTATSKETGTTSVFKSKDARDAAVKAGTHLMKKDDKDGAVKDPTKKDTPKVNIFKKDKSTSKSSKSSKSFSDSDIEDALEDSVQLDDFLDSNKDKISKEDFESLKSLKGAIQALEGDIVDAEMDDDEELMDEYESELQQNKEEATAILNKYKTTSPKKGTSGTSTTLKNSIKKIVTKGRKGNLSPRDLKDFGTEIADDLTPEQKAQYDKLIDNLFQANKAYNNAPDDEAYWKASDAYDKAYNSIYDYLDSIIKPKENTTMKLKDLLPENIINEGTRSQVGIIDRSGKIASIYVHYDGYPSNMKPGLKKHMKNEKDVLKLIKMGGASGIYADKPEIPYYKKGNGMKPLKGSDKDINGFLDKTKDSWADYVYLYNMKDRKWYYADPYKDKDLKKLF